MQNTLPDTVCYKFFDLVWLVIDEDGGSPGMGQVVGILFKPGATMYQVQWCLSHGISYHYAQELTTNKPTDYTTPS